MLQVVVRERGKGSTAVVAVRTNNDDHRPANGRRDGEIVINGEVVLVDDHPIWLDALEALLASKGMRVVGKVTSAEAALKLVSPTRPDALIVSLDLGDLETDGLDLVRRARERSRGLRIVAFSARHDPFHLRAAVTAGADAFLPKTADAAEVAQTVRECLVGERRSPCAAEPNGDEEAAQPALTARELEIVELAARGYTNAQIAQRLWVTKWTVKFHLVNAYRKLGVSNRTQAARYLFEHGLAAAPGARPSAS
jgi:DNA-binding NarL/FixJ family response regulator